MTVLPDARLQQFKLSDKFNKNGVREQQSLSGKPEITVFLGDEPPFSPGFYLRIELDRRTAKPMGECLQRNSSRHSQTEKQELAGRFYSVYVFLLRDSG